MSEGIKINYKYLVDIIWIIMFYLCNFKAYLKFTGIKKQNTTETKGVSSLGFE